MFKRGTLTLRILLILVMALVIMATLMGTGYVLLRDAQYTLMEEKQVKLFAFAKLLDISLDRTYNQILEEKGLQNASREEKIRALNEELKEVTDFVAHSEPGIGVGYYSKELDAIITYGPSEELGHNVGQPIAATHQGREVMRTGEEIIQTADLVRGEIMNCMHPIIRNGETIGYIWSNELVEDINIQMNQLQFRFRLTIFLGVVLAFVGAALIADSVVSRVNMIKHGLRQIQDDLDYRFPALPGEVGEIGEAINEMAAALGERRRLMVQMQRADRLAALGEIAAGVAHEIRNPLTSIKGFVQLIEEELSAEDPRLEYTQIVIREVDRMNRIINELLYYARPSESEKISGSINRIIEDTLFLINIKTINPKVQVHTQLNSELPNLCIDVEQIKQVFMNLLINSIQAIEKSGEINLETSLTPDGKLVRIAIRDTGKGIKPENLKKLFDPFFTTRDKGTGLGLAVVQKIVEMHRGYVEVESQPGQGTTFTVFLPLSGGERINEGFKKEDFSSG